MTELEAVCYLTRMVKWFFSTLLVSISAAWVDLISLQVIDYTYACGRLRTNRLQHFLQCGKLMMRWMWYWLEFSDLLSIIFILCAAHVATATPDRGRFLSSLWTRLKYSKRVTVQNISIDALFPCVLYHLLIICFKDAIFFTFTFLYLF